MARPSGPAGDTPIAQLIRRLRLQSGMTLVELAERIGVTESSVSNYELSRRVPGRDVCIKLARVLGAPPEQLLAAAGHAVQAQKERAAAPSAFVKAVNEDDRLTVDEQRQLIQLHRLFVTGGRARGRSRDAAQD